MASYTTHYGLHQWVPEDNFLRTDFNEDLEKIDTALGEIAETADGKVSVVFGSYTGDTAKERFINLGFRPVAVYCCTSNGIAGALEGNEYCYGGLAFSGHPVRQGTDLISIETNGFRIYQPNIYTRTNEINTTYHYIAFE